MNYQIYIQLAEQLLKNPLEEFLIRNFDKKKMPSHGLDHHRRVWEYAKELFQYIDPEDEKSDPLFIMKLLIACYLHDIGISIDHGSRHGLHSRKLCEQFLLENDISISDYRDVLDAIENHDNKEYTDSPGKNKLLMLLSVADDLDAFGYTGIYRYIEIYFARGIKPEKVGQMVRENAGKRFKNFKLNFNRYPELIRKHKTRYMVLDNFFEGFSKEIDGNK